MSVADTVAVALNYSQFPTDGSKPFVHINTDPVTGKQLSNIITIQRDFEIENVRGKEDQYNLDNAGFQYLKNKASHTKFTDDEEIKKEYYEETIAFLKNLLGAGRVVIFDHTIRRHRPGTVDDSEDKRQPVSKVHVDQTPGAAANRVRRHVPDDAAELLKHRYQIINIWRPISHPADESPLAVCDYRSLNRDTDLIPTILRFPTHDGETFGVNYSPNHKWKYLRGMTPEEVLLIKCFDSNKEVATLTPHTAFVDPKTPKDAPHRESIELRALVFYED
ncbi:hypothetical protein M422DRAFT_25018 [Sphaerobolus stellatus SS14]|nr:hypothetical protein M422DRAFT_25018 [Sphaerobolus stellatus SS14]